MIKYKNKKFEVQSIHKCICYNWSKNKNEHCAIIYSESLDRPINAYVKYSECPLDSGNTCTHYNCGVQLI